MRSPKRIWVFSAAVLAAVAVAAVFLAVGPLRKIAEFGRAEAVKGYWTSLQDFEKQSGRYPRVGL
jgi:hypothetical protein